jgi:hypothetical protein
MEYGLMESKKVGLKITAITIFLSVSIFSSADSLTIPNTFSSGSTTNASDMNANFSAVKTAVDDNDQRITALENATAPVFQGFSSSSMNGGQGLRAMQSACDASFSGSKICKTEEYANSIYNSSAANVSSSGTAWILPSIAIGGGAMVETVSGRYYTSDHEKRLTCRGWREQTDANYTGTVINESGGVSISNCTISNKIACCK